MAPQEKRQGLEGTAVAPLGPQHRPAASAWCSHLAYISHCLSPLMTLLPHNFGPLLATVLSKIHCIEFHQQLLLNPLLPNFIYWGRIWLAEFCFLLSQVIGWQPAYTDQRVWDWILYCLITCDQRGPGYSTFQQKLRVQELLRLLHPRGTLFCLLGQITRFPSSSILEVTLIL